MIKLKKSTEPQVLIKNSKNWTDAFLKKLSTGEIPTSTESSRYRHKEIKAALVAETHGKCAYCESKVQHIHHGDVEHIAPKSLHPEKRFEWNNLTLACEICNQNKSNRDPKVEYIIDPYVIDPADHLIFMGTFLFPLGTPMGKSTEVMLDLNRVALLERRKARLEQIMGIFETILRDDLPVVTRKIIYEDLLQNECAGSSEYSAMIKSIVSSMSEKIPKEILQSADKKSNIQTISNFDM